MRLIPTAAFRTILAGFPVRRNLLLSIVMLSTGAALAVDISGDWEFTGTSLGENSPARLDLLIKDNKLTGHLNEIILEGTAKDGDLEFSGKRPNGKNFGTFKGSLKGDNLEGTALWSGDRKVIWTARRAATPPAQPRVHEFEPKQFHRLFSDSIPPVLHIFPGDSVRTWTVDAGGVDKNGVTRSQGGNPETGPFYVEGAMPGDMLVIKLDRIRLNRDYAASGNRIMYSALSPGYTEQEKYAEEFDSTWTLDQSNGIARLKKPSEHLKDYTVKLQPMLGCIAVAPPAHQSFRTGFLGVYGGNMDFNQIREGCTVYLPVFAQGALLFVGDGHAAQGDGELTGDALETSMDVQFTVNLIRGPQRARPRVENDEYLMALGIANSLPEAVQEATTELAIWLQHDYKLSPNEAAMVLGTAMQYNIAELVDPLVHVVAKVRKDVLTMPRSTAK